MDNSVLSQEEISALLDDTLQPLEMQGENEEKLAFNEKLSSMEIDALGELANISMGSAATALSALLGKRVDITTPHVTLTTMKELKDNYPEPYVVVDVNYNTGLQGTNVLIIHTYDAGVIVDLMMGGDGTEPPLELNDLHLSAVSEAMNQMMGAACTSLSQVLNKRIDISPPTLELFELQEHAMLGQDQEEIIRISFKVVIAGLLDSVMMQLLPIDFAKEMVLEMMKKNNLTDYSPKHQAKPANQFAEPAAEPVMSPPERESMPQAIRQQQVKVSPLQLNQLGQETASTFNTGVNLDLILDVGLQLSVELGRTVKKIKEILELNAGSILELDKLAGEPVDILVNGKLLAKGEVVVIDENFGVRVTEILSPVDRVKSLK